MSWFYWAVAAAAFWGLGPIFARLGLEKSDAFTALLIRSTAVLAVLMAWGLLRGGLIARLGAVDKRTWLLLLLEGSAASVVAHFAYFNALKLGDLASVVPITASYPLFAMVLSAFLLGSRVTPGKWVGALLTVAGIYLLQRY